LSKSRACADDVGCRSRASESAHARDHGAADRHFATRTEQVETVIAAVTGWARQEQGWDRCPDWSLPDL
jgi:hypothetical protein